MFIQPGRSWEAGGAGHTSRSDGHAALCGKTPCGIDLRLKNRSQTENARNPVPSYACRLLMSERGRQHGSRGCWRLRLRQLPWRKSSRRYEARTGSGASREQALVPSRTLIPAEPVKSYPCDDCASFPGSASFRVRMPVHVIAGVLHLRDPSTRNMVGAAGTAGTNRLNDNIQQNTQQQQKQQQQQKKQPHLCLSARLPWALDPACC